MAGFNTNVVTSRIFNYIDPLVLEPNKGELKGRDLFPIKYLGDPLTNTYTYFWKERMGQASDTADRATDGRTVDVTYHEEIGYVTEKSAYLEYSQEEIDRANKGHIDVLADKTQAAHDALNDWDDQLIFNGVDDSRKPIYGVTTDPTKAGFQTIEAPSKTLAQVVDPSNKDSYQDAYNLVNYFMDAVEKITLLPGYQNRKPVLILPPKEYNLLNRPLLSETAPGWTIMKMLQSSNNENGATFSRIEPVEELKAQYWNTKKGKEGKRNMGMIYLDDPKTAQIQVAMEAQRYGQVEYTDHKWSIEYKERSGGLSIKFPDGFVRLDGLNDGSEKWA